MSLSHTPSLRALHRKSRPHEKGQVAILFALVFTFMFVLFAFVVDFAHLINNKINLQIAADSAAYAGAAWQARIMNRMGAVNYRLRQDLKELAMRLQVTHVRHNRNFPRGGGFYNGGDGDPRGFFPFVCQQANGYVANSGLRYQNNTNLCRNASPEFGGLPPIVVPPVIAAFDPFAVAIAAQIRRIQEASDRECRAAAQDNRRLVDHLKSVYENRTQFHVQQLRTLEAYLNEVSSERGPFSNDNTGNGPLVKTALQSAIRNLSASNNREFKMQILQPQTGEYIRLNDNRTNGSIFYYDFQVIGSGCVGQPKILDGVNVSTGMYKENAIITYFAVKLSAKPDMLFMPQAWADAAFPTLEAFAAAKPFGSRIGPQPTADQLLPVANRPGNNNRLFNFSFKPGDGRGIMNTKLMAFFDALHPFNVLGNPDGNQNSGWPDPAKADNIRQPLLAIRAPTIFDATFFTVFPDPGGNANQDYTEPQYAEVLYPDYLEAAGPDNTIIQTPNPRTPAYFPSGVGSKNRGTGWIQINADPVGGGGPYGNYATEDVGSHSVVGAASLPIAGGGKERDFGFATKDMISSGWTPDGRPGRIGYSVKFIGMDALRRTLQVTLDQSGQRGRIANPPTGDINLDNIYH